MREIVERGKARCPRCGTITDYSFVEDDTRVSYQTHFHACTYEHIEIAQSLPAA